ncbi:MAG: diaminopimelate epimerase [Acidobacteriota bacterium]|nr:diaminopimelate epimerase [Acidobacteriota bacterium]
MLTQMIPAFKYHSYGNDFVVVAPDQVQQGNYSDFAKAICNNHFGIGADGCVFVEEIASGSIPMKIFNRDGSEAGISGNGFRCGCAFLHHHDLVNNTDITITTGAGMRCYSLVEKKDGFWTYQSQMGSPIFEPADIPFCAPSELHEIKEYSLDVGGDKVSITVLSVGNPQCIVFVEELPQKDNFQRLGRLLECHPDFPQRTNVSFVQVVGSNQLKIKLWERGVGPTCSSGTGSCAAAVATILAGKVQSPVIVTTETGFQKVEWDGEAEIHLTGDARFIAEINFYWECSR